MLTFGEILLFLKLKRQDFVPIFLLLKNCAKILSGSRTVAGTGAGTGTGTGTGT
jgi:hypothetical protein